MLNYFNYFTEIEEHFQACRQTGGFLLSPLDWALIETWKEAEIPLEAVLKGIDRAFEKYHQRKRKFRSINSLAYCTQEVLTAAREMAEGGTSEERRETEQGFDPAAVAKFFRENAELVLRAAEKLTPAQAETLRQTTESLTKLAEAADAGVMEDLESVEQRLTVLEERMIAAVTQGLGEDDLLEIRREMERELSPYRRKMTAEQITMLEKQYLQREALARVDLPRLSLFYLH